MLYLRVYLKTIPGRCNYEETNLSVNYIKQNVGIKLSESGAKAAAVTSIGIMKSSLVVDPITIKLDRPFLYLIKDENNVLLFVGILNYPTTSNASF